VIELDLSGPERRLRDLNRALKSEENGRQLRRELTRNLRSALAPVRQEARHAIRSLRSRGHRGRSIRTAIAQRLQIKASASGRSAGARIIARTVTLRGFIHAPRRFNAPNFTHPVPFSDDVTQVGKPGWFDDTVQRGRPRYRKAVIDAMDHTASRIARKA
jgi:hypothetical protein